MGDIMVVILATDVLDVAVFCQPENDSGRHQNEEKGIHSYFVLILPTDTSEVVRTNFC